MSKFYTLSIKEIKKETPNAVSVVFTIPSELTIDFNFTAGQYVNIKNNIAGSEIRRAYSICSSPNSNEFRIAIKAVDNGTFSVFATTVLKEGDVLEVSKPEGRFVLETSANHSNNYLGIAAGSGITPIISMIKAVLSEEPKSTFTLMYSNKTMAETIFKRELDALLTKYPNQLKMQYVFSREKNENNLFGRIDEGNINFIVKNKFKDVDFNSAFLCGPEEMINVVKDTLIKNGFNASNIFFELFAVPVSSEKETINHKGTCNITVLVDDEETTFSMDTNSTILTAALKEGLDAPYSCQGGICSTCIAKVTEGKATMEKNTILSDDEVSEGFVLTCQAKPITSTIKVDYDQD